jgi:hypothetical protein
MTIYFWISFSVGVIGFFLLCLNLWLRRKMRIDQEIEADLERLREAGLISRFCKYCGEKTLSGEICDCPTFVNEQKNNFRRRKRNVQDLPRQTR